MGSVAETAGGSHDRRSQKKSMRTMRRNFLAGLGRGLHVVWPVLSAMIFFIVALGIVIGMIEGWRVQDSVYFSFVTGLTIGYGDLVPKTLLTRALAMCIGAMGILLMALIAAVAVKALSEVESAEGSRP